MRKLRLTLLFAIFLLPSLLQAETVLRSSDVVVVNEGQTVVEDLYAKGRSVNISGTVLGDFLAIGGQVTVNGSIESDLMALAGVAQIHGPIKDDLRLLAGEVVIGDAVGGDIFVFGGVLNILSTAEVKGDVFFFGGEASIHGPVGGSIMGTYDSLHIDSSVGGNVDVKVSQSLTLSAQAKLGGNLSYSSNTDLHREPSTEIKGDVVANTNDYSSVPIQELTLIFILLFGTLVMYLLFRSDVDTFASHSCRYYKSSLLVGVAVTLLAPVVIIILLYTILGSLLGLLLVSVYLVCLMTACLIVPAMVGFMLHRLFERKAKPSLTSLLIGSLFIGIILLIPSFGILFFVVAATCAVGSISILFYKKVLE